MHFLGEITCLMGVVCVLRLCALCRNCLKDNMHGHVYRQVFLQTRSVNFVYFWGKIDSDCADTGFKRAAV